MAAPFITEASFENHLPLIDIVIRELTMTTGMVISCQEAGMDGGLWGLSNQKAAMEIDLMPYVEAPNQKHSYLIASDPFSKWNPYLHQTLLFVLLKLGGKSEDQLEAWAGQPWPVVREHWNPKYLRGFEAWYKR
jgi:hypothetical protein